MKTAAMFALLLMLALPAGAQSAAAGSTDTQSDKAHFVAPPQPPNGNSHNEDRNHARAANTSSGNDYFWNEPSQDLSSDTGGGGEIPLTPDSVTFAEGDDSFTPSTVLSWKKAVSLGRKQQAGVAPKTEVTTPTPSVPSAPQKGVADAGASSPRH